MKKIELLSPAKNLEIGIDAINHGADAVYIGGPGFGAREKACNSIQDIEKLCRYASIYDAKVYVTLNTLLYDNELEQACSIAWDCWNAGVDALIVQDMALLKMPMPPIALHASTQCHNTSAEKVKFLEDVGFKQVVLARELSINEIKAIREKTEVALEFFVHGALCVSFSGQCYLSKFIGNRSANRGACAQPCRLKWDLENEWGDVLVGNRHLLSLKDLNNSSHIEELIDAGITSFKIEGRLKDSDYVKNTTAYYRKAIDDVLCRRNDLQRGSRGVSTPSFVPALEKSFSRGFTDYFIHGRQKNIDAALTPKSVGEHIGTARRFDSKRVLVDTHSELHNGDGLCFLDDRGELCGFNVNGVDGDLVLASNPLSLARLPKSGNVDLYRNLDIVWQKAVENSDGKRKIDILLTLNEIEDGFLLNASLPSDADACVSLPFHLKKEPAKNPEMAMENIRKKLSQWGDTKFTPISIIINLDEAYFLPASALGEMKRLTANELEELLIEKHRIERETASPVEKKADFITKDLSYLDNVINEAARQFYDNHGVEHVDDGLDKTMPEGELVVMTTKHCIRFSNGMCLRRTKAKDEPLFISNENGRFRLDFDCKNCCMKVVALNNSYE
ncbi:MAG: U32 family peptidase [Bacteroidales bacterium]|nr:U32 family peptidase [Bacteroidales bacterium]